MNDFIKNWKEFIAAVQAKDYVTAAEKFGYLVVNISQIVKLFGGLNALEVQAKVEKLHAENHPLFATQATAEGEANFGIQDIVAIVAVIQSVIALFGKWFGKQ